MKTSILKTLDVLVTKLQGLVFPVTIDGVACPFAYQNLFESVKVFDLDDMTKAFAELLVFKKRVAIVVHFQELQSTKVEGQVMHTGFHQEFHVYASDQSYKSRSAALVGSADTPGVLQLAEQMVMQCAGEISRGYICEPMGGQVFNLVGKDRDEQIGRTGWRQDFMLHGGGMRFSLSHEAKQTYAAMVG